MTDIQAGCGNAQAKRSDKSCSIDVPTQDHVTDATLCDDSRCSPSPISHGRLRPRPKRSLASFTTYLNAHRPVPPTNKPEWPSFDWSNLNDRDQVCRCHQTETSHVIFPDTHLVVTHLSKMDRLRVLCSFAQGLQERY